jgi:hypothetical protein
MRHCLISELSNNNPETFEFSDVVELDEKLDEFVVLLLASEFSKI